MESPQFFFFLKKKYSLEKTWKIMEELKEGTKVI